MDDGNGSFCVKVYKKSSDSGLDGDKSKWDGRTEIVYGAGGKKK